MSVTVSVRLCVCDYECMCVACVGGGRLVASVYVAGVGGGAVGGL